MPSPQYLAPQSQRLAERGLGLLILTELELSLPKLLERRCSGGVFVTSSSRASLLTIIIETYFSGQPSE